MLTAKEICAAFCGELEVRNVPAGLAVRTPFLDREGDPIGFYVVPDTLGKSYRIEDSGLAIPKLEASGLSLSSGTRAEALRTLLAEYKAHIDEDSLEIHSEYMDAVEVPSAALRFSALLLRVQDLDLLRPETVESSFADDVRAAVTARFVGLAKVTFPSLDQFDSGEYQPDILVTTTAGYSASVFLGLRDARVDEAVMAWMEAQLKKHSKERYAVIYEQERHTGVSSRSYRRAMNRLDANLVYRSDESGAVDRIARMVHIEESPRVH